MDTTTLPTKTNDMITLSIDGMSCGHCITAVTKSLSAVPGVRVESVEIGTAQIEIKDASTAGQAVAALEASGYPARTTTADAPEAGKVSRGCCG